MSVYFDTITLIMSCTVLAVYSRWLLTEITWITSIGFASVVLYLFAQTGWTLAFFQGDVWGRDFNNYIWFGFNTLIMILLGLIWFDHNNNNNNN